MRDKSTDDSTAGERAARREVENARSALSGLSRLVRRSAPSAPKPSPKESPPDPVMADFGDFLAAVSEETPQRPFDAAESPDARDGAGGPMSESRQNQIATAPAEIRPAEGATNDAPGDEPLTAGDAFGGFAWD